MTHRIPRTIGEIMTRDVYVLDENDNLAHLLETMRLLRFRHTPVVDGDKAVGMLTERDLLRVSASSLLPSAREQDALLKERFHVRDIMTRDVITVSEGMPLREAGQLLLRKRVGCLLVVDADNRLLGLVTENDLAKLALSLLESR